MTGKNSSPSDSPVRSAEGTNSRSSSHSEVDDLSGHTVLVILVEGHDDKQFFQRIIAPRLSRYKLVEVCCFQPIFHLLKEQDEQIDINTLVMKCSQYLDAIDDNWDYFLVADRDEMFNGEKDKYNFLKRYIAGLEDGKVAIVDRTIESWYAAGIPEGSPFYQDIRNIHPEQIGKKFFDKMAKQRKCTNSQLKGEVLDHYDLRTGMRRSASLRKAVTALGLNAGGPKGSIVSQAKGDGHDARKARECPDCKGTGHCKCTNPQLKARIKKDDHGKCTLCQGSEKCQLCSGTGSMEY